LWITEHATAYQGEAKLMKCEHKANLAEPTKDMLMGSTGVARPTLPKSIVANLRHQSIINMNETKDSAISRQDRTTPWNSNFF
jgi:hypothetical protein